MSTQYVPNTTKPHWGGAASDIDQHLEKYDGWRDSKFLYTSQFVGLSNQKSVANETNVYRFDQLNTSEVLGRGAGEDIKAQAVTSDKVNVIVEMMMYIRNPIDYMHKWTAPDYLQDMARNNGSAFAKAFDEAHIITLLKARNYVAPAHLKPAFNDGMAVTVDLKGGTALTSTDLEKNAEALYLAIGKIVETLIDRDTPIEDMVCLVTVDMFSTLLNHPKLINKDYVETNGDFARRRLVYAHGIPVVVNTSFPRKVKTNHILSTTQNKQAFDVTAEDLKGKIVVFDKNLSLVTVTAQPFTSRFWDNEDAMCNVLDCYSMWTVASRRQDVSGVVLVTEV